MAEKAHAAGKRTGGVGFLCIWLFCQIIRSFRNQPVKVALIGPILQYPELFKLFLGKGFCPHTRFAGQKNNLYNGKG